MVVMFFVINLQWPASLPYPCLFNVTILGGEILSGKHLFTLVLAAFANGVSKVSTSIKISNTYLPRLNRCFFTRKLLTGSYYF